MEDGCSLGNGVGVDSSLGFIRKLSKIASRDREQEDESLRPKHDWGSNRVIAIKTSSMFTIALFALAANELETTCEYCGLGSRKDDGMRFLGVGVLMYRTSFISSIFRLRFFRPPTCWDRSRSSEAEVFFPRGR